MSLFNADRAVTIASGEMYPERGMSVRQRVTRSVADESSFGNSGNKMWLNSSECKRGEDPPKNELGSGTGVVPCDTESFRSVSAGNGSSIASMIFLNCESGIHQKRILHTRSRWLSLATIFFSSLARNDPCLMLTTIGNAGNADQTSSVPSLFLVQRSRRFRRCGEAKMICRHCRQTCTSVCHLSSSRRSRRD